MASQSRTLVKSKDVRSREDLADLLESLAGRVRNGTMTMNHGGGEVVIQLPGALHVDIEVKDSVKPERTKRELEIEMWWEIDDAEQPVGDAQPSGGLSIT